MDHMGRAEDVPPINQKAGRGDSTQNRWIVLGILGADVGPRSIRRAPQCAQHSFTFLLEGRVVWVLPSHPPLEPTQQPPSGILPPQLLPARPKLWTASRVSYQCNWKCFVMAFRPTLMDVKLNELWVLVILGGSRGEIYHRQLPRPPGAVWSTTSLYLPVIC